MDLNALMTLFAAVFPFTSIPTYFEHCFDAKRAAATRTARDVHINRLHIYDLIRNKERPR
jgi:hypothetical protein